MIPGWLNQTLSTNQPIEDTLLPMDYVAVYNDRFGKGRPTILLTKVAGEFTSELVVLSTRFDAAIVQRGCHGTCLIDMIS